MTINSGQIALSSWITEGLKIPEVRGFHGDARYLLNNMIAKYSLASDKYLLSQKAVTQLKKDGVDLSDTYYRSHFYGKSFPYTYEHAVPAGIVRARLLEIEPTLNAVQQLLKSSGPVAMILRSEDEKLNKNGLRQKMPENWEWGADPLARYQKVEIQIAQEKLNVKGALCR